MRRLAVTLTILAALPLPAAADAYLSDGQARWFTEREVSRFADAPRFGACWRLSPVTVACEAHIPDRAFSSTGPRMRIVEICELDGEYMRLTLSTSGTPLTQAETAALGL